ncbi:MAG: Smr/MutS family protein [Gloeobacteraceae cyanobacterium ES-bin-316]|nr:Smr/MutS family protein [Ferruginibacter sp.]
MKNSIAGLSEFYLHDVSFDDMSDNPRFDIEFSLQAENKKKALYFETSLKVKAKQLFKKLEETQAKNEPTFSYELFVHYPERVEEERVDLSRLGNAGYRVYDAKTASSFSPPPRSVIDLHIEKLIDSWKHLSNFEIMTMQLNEFEKYYELAVAHHQPTLIVIHGVGEGKLRDEIHEILRLKKEVKSFVNQFHPLYGFGATEIYFN